MGRGGWLNFEWLNGVWDVGGILNGPFFGLKEEGL